MALKDNGYTIEMFTGWLRDYRQFKALIENEPDQMRKINYQKNLNMLQLFPVGNAPLCCFDSSQVHIGH